jgi:hypothetical protein
LISCHNDLISSIHTPWHVKKKIALLHKEKAREMTRTRALSPCVFHPEEKKYCLFDNQSVKWMNAHIRDETTSGMIMD